MGIPSLLLEINKHYTRAAFKLRVLCFVFFVSTLQGVADKCETTPFKFFFLKISSAENMKDLETDGTDELAVHGLDRCTLLDKHPGWMDRSREWWRMQQNPVGGVPHGSVPGPVLFKIIVDN